MTTVYYFHERDQFLISAFGHATGSEAVCAAVSGILGALAGFTINIPEHIFDVYVRQAESGKFKLYVRGDEIVKAAFDMAYIGLKQIEMQKPDYIKVIIPSWDTIQPSGGPKP